MNDPLGLATACWLSSQHCVRSGLMTTTHDCSPNIQKGREPFLAQGTLKTLITSLPP